MATVYSGNYSTGASTYTRVKVDYSGTSATATLLYTRTNTWSGDTSADNATFTFGGNSVTFSKHFYGQQTDAVVASVNFSISTSGGTYSGSTSGAGLLGFSGSVSIPAQSSGPTGITASDLIVGTESFTATVSVTGWGTGGSTSSRWKELQVWTYNASSLTTPRRYAIKTENTLSSTITVTNSSVGTDPLEQLLTIVGNTRYTLGIYANNGAASTSSVRWRDAVTLPYKPVARLDEVSKTSATFSINVHSDGGFYTKDLYYSLDGTNWILFSKIESGNSTTIPLTVSNLSTESSYTLRTKVVTTAGEVQGDSLSFTTSTRVPTLYSSNTIQRATTTNRILASVSDVATNVKRIYGSVNGQAQIVFDRTSNRTASPCTPTKYGTVFYRPSSSSSEIKSVELQSVAEFESLCSTSSTTYTWTATIGKEQVTVSSRNNNAIVGIDIGTEITTIPDFFLYSCSYYRGDLIVPPNVTTIGTYFAGRCGNSNNRLSVVDLGKNVTSLGTYCLTYSYFENGSSVLIMPGEISAIPNYFMYYAYNFNSSITISPKATSIGTYFLSNCTSFNSNITFSPVLTTIGTRFLDYATAFNKDIKLPNTLTSIGTYFLYRCNSMTSTVNVNNLAATVASASTYTFSTTSNTAAMYTSGIKIAGSTRANWISRFANRTSSPYRKLVDAGY